MIFDCFTFFGHPGYGLEKSAEFELLKIRCEELKPLGVTHVLVEANYTFSGLLKPTYFTELGIENAFYKYPIRASVINLHPPDKDPWANERAQRNAIKTFLKDVAQDGDTVIISDVDEIVFKSAVESFSDRKDELQMSALCMDKFGYFLNVLEGRQSWKSARIMTWEYLKDKTPDEVRNSGYPSTINDAGHHYSWLGGVNQMLSKFKAFSHQEESVQQHADPVKLKQKYENVISLWGEDSWQVVPIDPSFPEYIRTHQDELSKYIKPWT